jgi:hypothetical protein
MDVPPEYFGIFCNFSLSFASERHHAMPLLKLSGCLRGSGRCKTDKPPNVEHLGIFLIFIIVSAVPVSFMADRHHAMHPLELCQFLEFGLGVAITLRLHVQHFLLVACVTEWWVS